MEKLRESYDPIEGSESEDEDTVRPGYRYNTNFEKLVLKYIDATIYMDNLIWTRAQQNALAKQLKENFIHTLDQKS